MRSWGRLFPLVIDRDNLGLAARAAARGKNGRPGVIRFFAELEDEIDILHRDLRKGQYQPREYRQFRVFDPKPRTISCADFRDRVVHHAVCDVLSPMWERRFIFDTFACRKGKGTHRAVLRAQEFAREFRFYLKLDVRKFFESVSHDVLLEMINPMLREKQLRSLLGVIIQHPVPGQNPGRGLPIGNLTSQWFANLYLDGLDHWAKEYLRVPRYLRYMDDLLFFANSKGALWRVHDEVSAFMDRNLRLSVKAEVTRLAPCTEGIPFLGMRIFPGMIRVQHGRLWRSRRRLQKRQVQWAKGLISDESLVASARAVHGVLEWFGFSGLLQSELEI